MKGEGSTGLWIVIVLAVCGVGCIASIVVLGALAGAGVFVASRQVEAPIVQPAIDPSIAPDAGMPFCPGYGDERIRLYAQLTATRFVLEATDGTSYPMPYEGDAYPLEALRARLVERRQQEPNRYDIFVTTEPGVPASMPGRVVALAREVGFSEAIACRERTELDALMQGDAPGAVGDPSIAAGDPDGSGALGDPGAEDPMEALRRLMEQGAGEPRDDESAIAAPEGGHEGATGSGYGRGAGGLRRDGRVRTGNLDVRGSLAPQVIRRVIQRHLAEVRACYEQSLRINPELEGRVAVSFIISRTGTVLSSSVSSTTLSAPSAEACIVRAVRRWTFPAPDGGGVVGVTAPFVLSVE